jgi:hypothetical protein
MARSKMKKYLFKGLINFLPKGIGKSLEMDAIQGVFLPGFIFDAYSRTTWNGESALSSTNREEMAGVAKAAVPAVRVETKAAVVKALVAAVRVETKAAAVAIKGEEAEQKGPEEGATEEGEAEVPVTKAGAAEAGVVEAVVAEAGVGPEVAAVSKV